MKKKILLMLTLLAGVITANAADNISVSKAVVKKGSTGTIVLDLNNTEKNYVAFSLNIALPSGVSFVGPAGAPDNKQVSVTKSGRLSADHTIYSKLDGGFVCLGTDVITGTSGPVLTIDIQADETVNIGDELDATISAINMTDEGRNDASFANVNFKISVIEDREILDEESTEAPAAATGVNVKVKRTIKANEWSTICLPFAMDATQMKAAFGADVQLKNFISWESEEDDGGNIVKITANFEDATAVEANHPYVIKVSSDITEFNVDGVDIDPEAEPSVEVGKKKAEKGFFTGTYVANTTVPADNVFLADNMFWYSTGATKIKAFRGYFEFYDVLDDKTATSRIVMNFDGEATGINSVLRDALNDGKVYDLNGRQVEKPGKGVFIVNGKKVVIK